MLEFLRRGVKSWVAKVMLGLLVASFAVWGIGDIFSFSLNSPVATVGTRTVTADSFADALQRQQSRASREAQRAVTLTEIRRSGLGDQVLAGLIRDAAVGAELAEIGVSASDEAVARAIRQLDAFRGPDGEFSSTAYRSFLAQQGFNPAQFEALQRDLLGQEMLLSAVAGTGTAPPGVAARLAALEGEERRFDILTLDLEMAPEPATPDSTTLGAFLEENALLFQEPDRKYGRYLHVDVRALAEAHEPTEQDLRAGYDAAADRFVTPAQATIEQLNFSTAEEAAAAMAALDGGKSFDDLLADRELTAADVSLGTVGRDGLPESIAEAVFALDAPGIAGPVETLLGEALLRVTEISAETVTPFEEARAALAQALKDRHAISRAPQLAGDIDDRRAAGETLDEITAALDGVTLGQIDGWAIDGTLLGGAQADGVLGRARVREELGDALDGEERDLIELANGGFFVAEIERVEPSYLPTLDTIEDRVAEAWERRQRLDALIDRATRIEQGLARGTGATLASIGAGMGRTVGSLAPLSRGEITEGAPAALLARLFDLPQGGATHVELPGGEGVIIGQVTEILPLEPEALAQRAETLSQAIGGSIGRDQALYFARAVEIAQQAQVDQATVQSVYELLGAHQAGFAGETQ